MPINSIITLGTSIVSVAISFLSIIVIWIGRKMDPEGTKYLFALTISSLLLSITYGITALYLHSKVHISFFSFKVTVFIQYNLSVITGGMLIAFILYSMKNNVERFILKKHIYIVLIVTFVLSVINIYVPFIYCVDVTSNVHPLCFGIVISCSFGLFLIYLLYFLYQNRFNMAREVFITSALVIFGLIVSILLYMIQPSFDLFGYILAITIFLMVMFVETGLVVRYTKDEYEYNKIRTQLILHQMRPHFLYNALSSISQLCSQDPQMASEMTIRFLDYFTKNMADLSQSDPIPFSKEIEYIRNYMSIEQMRFGEDMKVHYDIQTVDFMVPPMVIQPILENAIKHGIGSKDEGGNIYIFSRAHEGGNRIIISDDGVGFDSEEYMKQTDQRVHVGLKSVSNRISKIEGAHFILKSTPKEGTMAMIILPKSFGK